MIPIDVVLTHGFMPEYATDGSAGADIRMPQKVSIRSGKTFGPFDLGISVAIPKGYEGQLRLRSSMGKRGLCIPQGFGTIDSDYRGPLYGLLHNLNPDKVVYLEFGDRVFQLVIVPVVRAIWRPVDKLSDTVRGTGGFGSTGR